MSSAAYKQNYTAQLFEGRPYTEIVRLDFSDQNLAASGIAEILDFPEVDDARLIIHEFSVEKVTQEGGVATADFGVRPISGTAFTADPNGLDDAVNLNTATVVRSTAGTDAQLRSLIDISGGAQLYMTADNALDAAVIDVVVTYSYNTPEKYTK